MENKQEFMPVFLPESGELLTETITLKGALVSKDTDFETMVSFLKRAVNHNPLEIKFSIGEEVRLVVPVNGLSLIRENPNLILESSKVIDDNKIKVEKEK